jgi:son of sevenless-like protein
VSTPPPDPCSLVTTEWHRIVRRIDRKVNEWAALSRLKSFLQQREIKDGIDRLHRDMDAAMMKFNVQGFTFCPHIKLSC